MKKLFILLMMIIFPGCLVFSVSAQQVSLASVSAVLMDADSGRVLFEKNGHRQMYPASITKIMTGMLALEHLQPEQTLTMSKEAYYAIPGGAASIHLRPEEEITAEQALYALTVQSANDAANLLAEGVSGDLQSFCDLMNETAQSLGAEHTHFANANGLPRNDHYTTAYDMARIASAAIQVPELCRYFSTVRYTIPPTNKADWNREMVNDNKMLSGFYHDDDILMSKTGWTEDAQHTLVSAIRRGDTTLVAVVMYTVPVDSKYIDTWTLFDYGFSQFEQNTLSGEELSARLGLEQLPVENQQFSFLLPLGVSWQELELTLTQVEESRAAVEASYDGQPFPSLVLELQIPEPTEQTTQETTQPTEASTQPAPRESTPVQPRWFYALPAIAPVLGLFLLIFRKNRRSKR